VTIAREKSSEKNKAMHFLVMLRGAFKREWREVLSWKKRGKREDNESGGKKGRVTSDFSVFFGYSRLL